MILKLKAIKQIIKEELEKVINEDLYADEKEYQEAIKDFMELHNVSREEAKKAIDAAGDEMDRDHPEFGTSVEEERENIKAFDVLMKLAQRGKILHGKHAYLERQELHDLSMDFKNNLQKYFKKNEYYKTIYKGYEFCKTYMFDKYGFWDEAADAYGKLNKPVLQRDIGAAITMAKLEPQLQTDIEERTQKCEETLAFALSYVEEQIAEDEAKAARRAKEKKRREEREKAEKELINKGISQNYIYAALRSGLRLTDTLDWDMEKWEDWFRNYRRTTASQSWYEYEQEMDAQRYFDPRLRETKFTLTQNEIKQIIKEELEAVISEDLYADEEEYEQAIKDFMELHNVSRSEAKQAIDAAGDDMDKDYPVFGRYIEKEKQDIHSYKEFLRYTSMGEALTIGKDEDLDDDILELIYDFKSNYEEKYKNIRMFKKIHDGYQYCLNKASTMDVREPRGEKQFGQTLSDFGTELSKAQAPLMSRDLTALNRMRKSEEELEQLLKKRDTQCEKKLGFALFYAHTEQEENQRKIKIAKQRELKKQADLRAAKERLEKYGVKKGEVLEALNDLAYNSDAQDFFDIWHFISNVESLIKIYGTDLDVNLPPEKRMPGYDGLEKRLRRAILEARADRNYEPLSRLAAKIERLMELL